MILPLQSELILFVGWWYCHYYLLKSSCDTIVTATTITIISTTCISITALGRYSWWILHCYKIQRTKSFQWHPSKFRNMWKYYSEHGLRDTLWLWFTFKNPNERKHVKIYKAFYSFFLREFPRSRENEMLQRHPHCGIKTMLMQLFL